MLWLAAMGIGAALAPALIAWLGIETAHSSRRAWSLPALVARVRHAPSHESTRARPRPKRTSCGSSATVPIFAPLPGGSLEHLAGRLVPLRVDPGTVIVREGDAGDRFYIVAEGEVEVSQYGRTLSELEAGGYFGEIALLRDVPRTATVTAGRTRSCTRSTERTSCPQ